MTMKRTWLAVVFVAAGILLGGCATTKFTANPVTDPDKPVKGSGFSVLPPQGDQWIVMMRPDMDGLTFGKKDPEHIKFPTTVLVIARRVKASHNDISTPAGLHAEFEASVRATSGRFTLREFSLERYRDESRATDCLRINTAVEERNNPVNPGFVLLLSDSGYVCRHPLSPEYYVLVTISERRPVESPSYLNDSLRAEAERTLNSIRYLPGP